MLGHAWLTLKQATEALKNGRLDEAHRFLCQPDAHGHKGSWELLQQVARGYVERGERNLEHDDPQAAWNDLLQAEQIGGCDEANRLRQALVKRGLSDAHGLLEAGEPGRAVDVLAQLRDRAVQQAEVQSLEEVAKGWVRARALAARGEFAQAIQECERAHRLLSTAPAALDRFHQYLVQAGKSFAGLIVELLGAVESENWRDALQLSEQILALAPQHAEARKARARAWKSIEPSTTPSPRPMAFVPQPKREPSQRYLLWIDGVGGYLICLGTRITLGQATADAYVDVPLFADVSRVHAALTRDAEGYLLEAVRTVQVNGQPAERTLLRPGDRVTLGSCCQFQFQQPVPISASARLDMTSGHRLPLTIDKVFLMADTLILGPGPQAHVVIPNVQVPIVLYRHKDGLGVRYMGKLTIDGQSCHQRGVLQPNSKIAGEEFAMALEPVGAKFGHS